MFVGLSAVLAGLLLGGLSTLFAAAFAFQASAAIAAAATGCI